MVAANAMWKVVFQCLLQHLMSAQEAGNCTLYVHPATHSFKFAFQGAEIETDVVCVYVCAAQSVV